MLGKGIGERYANPAAPATYENVFSCYAEILGCRHTTHMETAEGYQSALDTYTCQSSVSRIEVQQSF